MNLIADLADKYTFGEFRTTHEQNISLVDVPQKDLFELWQTLNNTTWHARISAFYRYYLLPSGDFLFIGKCEIHSNFRSD